MKKWTLWVALLLVVAVGGVLAQERGGGQFWVRAYEDRNGNGTRDAGEPLITRGIAVDLLDESGTVVASALIDGSPNATQGLVGFQYLPAGSYRILVTSAYFSPTTQAEFNAVIDPSTPPTVVEFGGQRIAAAPALSASAIEQASADEAARQDAIRIAVSGLGALVMVGVMVVIGLGIYGFVLRPQAIRQAQRDMMRATQTGTGRFRAVVIPDDKP